MRSSIVTTTVLALATAGTLGLGSATASAAPATVSAKPHATAFALGGSGYGSRVRGGQVPAGSGSTAYEEIGCTNVAGLQRENHVAEEQLPGVGVASEISTKIWTTDKKGVVGTTSRSTIARLDLAGTPLGSVTLTGIRAVAKAFHDDSGFHTSTSSSVAAIALTDPTGTTTPIDVPAPGQPVTIPGLGTLTIGNARHYTSNGSARAVSEAVLIRIDGSETRAKIGHTVATIDGGIKSGIFGGLSAASRATGLNGNVSVGRTPYLPMPCQGTDGKVQTNATASVNLGGQAVVSGLEDRQRGKQTDHKATGFESARVAGINVGDGQLVVQGIKGRVEVTRSGANLNQLDRSAEGTIGTITADGEPMAFPDTDVLEIPGVAKLERNVVRKFSGGIEIIALRITLLGGDSGGVITLGQAKLRIHKSGR